MNALGGKHVFPQLASSTAPSPCGSSHRFSLSLGYSPKSEVNSNHRPWLTGDPSEGGREPTARNHANFCAGARLRDVEPCWGASHRQCEFKLEVSNAVQMCLGMGHVLKDIRKQA